MITQGRIAEDLRPARPDQITAKRAPALQGLLSAGYLQLSLFHDRGMAAETFLDSRGRAARQSPAFGRMLY